MNPIEILQDRLSPPLDHEGNVPPVPIRHEAAVILAEVLKELRHINSPWYSPKRAATYLDVDVTLINRLKNEGALKAYYAPGMSHPRYKVTDLYALMRTGKLKKTPPSV